MKEIDRSRSFRSDINGLRAWAVLSVILFHFGVPGFQGGFVGVDVFFVISGFLMTGIVIERLERGRDSVAAHLLQFYWSRALRIMPALVTLCAVLLILGWFLLPPLEYKGLATHVFSAVTFMSNFKFWLEAGYFDVASHEKWLLHTWSLSVEWQFYMFLPLVIIGGWKLSPGRRCAVIVLGVGFLASLVMSVLFSRLYPSPSFFLLHTRAWELLAGGLVYLLADRLVVGDRARLVLEGIGLLIICASVIFLDGSTVWPGAWAVLPVFGTSMILSADRRKSLWTGSRGAQWLGDISYSLYLWHWPVVVFVAYIGFKGNIFAIFVGLGCTTVTAWLAYQYLEKPIRYGFGRVERRYAFIALAVMGASVAVPAVTVRLFDGVRGRLNPEIEAVFAEAENKNPRLVECHKDAPQKVAECTYGGSELGVIVIGDSHAGAVVRSVEKAMNDPSRHVLDWTYSSCPTLAGVHKVDPKYGDLCGDFVNYALAKQRSLDRAPILIVNRSSATVYGGNEVGQEGKLGKPTVFFTKKYESVSPEYLEEFRKSLIDTACNFASVRPTYILRPIPELRRDVPTTMGRSLLFGKKVDVSISMDEYRARNAFVLEAQEAASKKCGVVLLDPVPILCGSGRCEGAKNGLPIYSDDDHLNERGAALLIPLFASVFEKEQRKSLVDVER